MAVESRVVRAHKDTSFSHAALVQEKCTNVLDSYESIQLPFHHKPVSSSKGNLTHPSQIRKRSGGRKKCGGQRNAIVHLKLEGETYANRKKRKSRDCPNVFDHLAMLHRKQQRCDEMRTSQEVPLSPQMESLTSDVLSMHPTPCEGVNDEEEDENKKVLGTAKVFFGPDQISEEENGGWRGSWKWNRYGGLSGSDSSSLLTGEGGNSLEFHSSRAVPVLSMERIRPCEGQLSLAQVPLHSSHAPQFQDTSQGPISSCSSSQPQVSVASLEPLRRQCSRSSMEMGNLSLLHRHEQ